jgi:pilus assembly protein CpaB
MILRLLLIVLILFGLAGFGTIGWVMLSPSGLASAPLPAPNKLIVLTLTRPLLPGMLLKPEDLAIADRNQASLPPGYVLDVPEAQRSLAGGVVRRALSPGDVLHMPGDVLRTTDRGFLAAVLAPGTRAVTVAADMISGAAGLIWPGDRVDLVLTQTIEDPSLGLGQRVAAETVLRDARVIAIDQQIGQGNPSSSEPQAAKDSPAVAKTVTLEVTPVNGQLVEVAAKLGRLTLALRSANAGPADALPPAAVWASDVSAALPKQAGRPAVASLRIYRGGADAKEFKF